MWNVRNNNIIIIIMQESCPFWLEAWIKRYRCKIPRATAWSLILPLPNREQIIETKRREVAYRGLRHNAFGHFVIRENKPVPVLQAREGVSI